MKPDPLTPPDCDLRNFSWMPLDVSWLRDSDLTAVLSAEAFRATMFLWCACWHQVPAASLPNDDRILAKLAGYGRDVESWTRVRDEALHGFVECSDGRLYHPVIATKALEADDQRKRQKERTQKATEARRGGKRNAEPDDNRNVGRHDNRDDRETCDRHGARNEVQQTGPDKDKERDKKKPKTPIESLERESRAGENDDATKADVVSGVEEPNPLGTTLPADWIPLAAEIATALGYGMGEADIEAELLTFHAYNAQHGTFSKNWTATWSMWCARWKEREAVKPKQAAPRTELNNQPTDANWDFGCKQWVRNESNWPRRSLGPSPGQPGCKCPAKFLEKYHIDPATGRVATPSETET